MYDAVAGRVSQWGLIAPQSTNSKTTANQPLRPDEVLFKGSNAPTRYEENDYYFAHDKLPKDQKLPSGDLLSALHAYITKYYARNEENGNQKVWKCMDETALIALGILMEETAREILGDSGDLVFLEGDEEGLGASPGQEEDSLGAALRGLREESIVSQNRVEENDSSSLPSENSYRDTVEEA